MTDEELMLKGVKSLCTACGMSIDRISRKTSISQDLVSELFMETMRLILDKMEEGETDGKTEWIKRDWITYYSWNY